MLGIIRTQDDTGSSLSLGDVILLSFKLKTSWKREASLILAHPKKSLEITKEKYRLFIYFLRKAVEGHQEGKSYVLLVLGEFCRES